MTLNAWTTAVAAAARDLVFPPQCPACRAETASGDGLCGVCLSTVRFLAGTPACAVCARPEPALARPDPDYVCDDCMAEPPAFGAVRAVGIYDGALRRLVLGLKHADRTDTVPLMAGWLARAGGAWLTEATHVVPVPLHWRRRLARRQNQSALLAARACRIAGRPRAYAPGLLSRPRATPSQGGRDRAARHANLAGALAVRAPLPGASVVVVDDVMTSGATLDAAARALRAAGAARVRALVVALVPRGPAPYVAPRTEEGAP